MSDSQVSSRRALQLLLERALRGQLSAREATTGLAWLYRTGIEAPEVEQALIPVAGDGGLASALAEQNAWDRDAQDDFDAWLAAGTAVAARFERADEEGRRVLRLVSPFVVRAAASGALIQLEGPAGTDLVPRARAASSTDAVHEHGTGKSYELGDEESGTVLRVTLLGSARGDVELMLDVRGGEPAATRVEISEGDAGDLHHAGTLEDFAEPVRLRPGRYRVRMRMRGRDGEHSYELPLVVE
jgi:hypothetical protein